MMISTVKAFAIKKFQKREKKNTMERRRSLKRKIIFRNWDEKLFRAESSEVTILLAYEMGEERKSNARWRRNC